MHLVHEKILKKLNLSNEVIAWGTQISIEVTPIKGGNWLFASGNQPECDTILCPINIQSFIIIYELTDKKYQFAIGSILCDKLLPEGMRLATNYIAPNQLSITFYMAKKKALPKCNIGFKLTCVDNDNNVIHSQDPLIEIPGPTTCINRKTKNNLSSFE